MCYMCIQWTRVLYSVVVVRPSNPTVSEFSRPWNEYTSVWSMFPYNISLSKVYTCHWFCDIHMWTVCYFFDGSSCVTLRSIYSSVMKPSGTMIRRFPSRYSFSISNTSHCCTFYCLQISLYRNTCLNLWAVILQHVICPCVMQERDIFW